MSEYLVGRLSVYYGIDTVVLVHKVHGRYSETVLDDGDLIEVKEGDDFKSITVSDALSKTVGDSSNKNERWRMYQSICEGKKARVRLHPDTTKRINLNQKKCDARTLFNSVERGLISHDEAMEILLEWQTDSGD